MSAADEAWQEWNANPDHEWLADSTQHAAFMAGYRRAESDLVSEFYASGDPCKVAVAELLAARAAAADPTERSPNA